MPEATKHPLTIDPLGHSAESFVAAAVSGGISANSALDAYRKFFRNGMIENPWITPPHITFGQQQVEGRTTKFTLRIPGDFETESVLIPMTRKDGTVTRTLCVSSQVGCAMGCEFCETAQMGLIGNLTTAQIVAQWYAATHQIGCRPKNMVFMGMGEPTDNLDAVIPAIRVLTDHDGAAMAASNISVSTVGNPKGIRQLGALASEPGYRRLNLAVSLNAPNDEIRTAIMPVGRAWPMIELRDAMLAWGGRRQSAICVEYVLIPGVNDAMEHCDEVCEYLRPIRCSLNIIPYNPRRDSPWPAPEEPAVDAFITRAIENGQFTKRRGTKGRTVMAACGQLGNPEIRKRSRDGQRVRIRLPKSKGMAS